MMCGVWTTMMTMAPLAFASSVHGGAGGRTTSSPQLNMNMNRVRASMDRMVSSLIDAPPPPPSVPLVTRLARSADRVARAARSGSRSELWRSNPEWFDHESGMFDAVVAITDLSRAWNVTSRAPRQTRDPTIEATNMLVRQDEDEAGDKRES